MPNEVVSPESSSTLAQFLQELNLPKLVAGPAGEAISKLIAGGVDIPAAWMQRIAQGIKDNTEARSVVSKAVAEAAATLAKNDPEVVQRAAHSLLTKQVRAQTNKEQIAKKTIEILKGEQSNPTDNAKPVDEDWMNVFSSHAENASSERMQALWARILAGQLREPHTFCLQTLNAVSQLDQQTAELFQRYAPHVVIGDFIPYPARQGDEFRDLMILEEFGLLHLGVGMLNKTFDRMYPALSLPYRKTNFVIVFSKATTISIECAILTRAGRELYTIIDTDDNPAIAQKFADRLDKTNVMTIVYGPLSAESGVPRVLWVDPNTTTPKPSETA